MRSLFLFTFTFLFAVASAQTNLFLIGCQHNPTKHLNSDSIVQLIRKIQPDLILMELDSSWMDNKGNFKGYFSSTEMDAIKKYKAETPGVQLGRFDFEGRNAYFSRTKFFEQEGALWKVMDSLFYGKKITGDPYNFLSVHYNTTIALSNLDQMDLKMLNSPEYIQLAKFRQEWMYNQVLNIIRDTEGLQQFYAHYKTVGAFWNFRNDEMAKNILNFVKDFKGKKIVVLVGSYHIYALLELLQPFQKEKNFTIHVTY